MLLIDHVVLGVRDLEDAGRRMLERHGLGSVPGGRHHGWGTANSIVPLGPAYVELVAVVDEAEAQASDFGRRVAAGVTGGDRLLTWCVATPDIETVAGRLGLEVTAGSRVRPDGTTLRWRSAGSDVALHRRFLPFFISWEVPDDLHPGRASAKHGTAPLGISWIEVSGSRAELEDWLGRERLPVRVSDGAEDIVAAVIATDAGDVRLTG